MKRNKKCNTLINLEQVLEYELDQVVGGKWTDNITLDNIERVAILAFKATLVVGGLAILGYCTYKLANSNVLEKLSKMTGDIKETAVQTANSTAHIQEGISELKGAIGSANTLAQSLEPVAKAIQGTADAVKVITKDLPGVAEAFGVNKPSATKTVDTLDAAGRLINATTPLVQQLGDVLSSVPPILGKAADMAHAFGMDKEKPRDETPKTDPLVILTAVGDLVEKIGAAGGKLEPSVQAATVAVQALGGMSSAAVPIANAVAARANAEQAKTGLELKKFDHKHKHPPTLGSDSAPAGPAPHSVAEAKPDRLDKFAAGIKGIFSKDEHKAEHKDEHRAEHKDEHKKSKQ